MVAYALIFGWQRKGEKRLAGPINEFGLPQGSRMSSDGCQYPAQIGEGPWEPRDDRRSKRAATARPPSGSPGAKYLLAPNVPTEEELYMRARSLIVVALFMAVLPVLSTSNPRNANPINLSALAGHTGDGGFCEDGTLGCLPGNPPLVRSSRAVGGIPVKQSPSTVSRSGSGVVPVMYVLLRWIVSLL